MASFADVIFAIPVHMLGSVDSALSLDGIISTPILSIAYADTPPRANISQQMPRRLLSEIYAKIFLEIYMVYAWHLPLFSA